VLRTARPKASLPVHTSVVNWTGSQLRITRQSATGNSCDPDAGKRHPLYLRTYNRTSRRPRVSICEPRTNGKSETGYRFWYAPTGREW